MNEYLFGSIWATSLRNVLLVHAHGFTFLLADVSLSLSSRTVQPLNSERGGGGGNKQRGAEIMNEGGEATNEPRWLRKTAGPEDED